MRFVESDLPQVFDIEVEPYEDSRGFFARTWCAREFAKHGLPDRMVQASISYNRRAGTLRGLHFQKAPSQEARLMRSASGAAFLVVLDLRPDSTGYLEHLTRRLDSARHNAVLVPPGCAAGFQTLEDDTIIFYQMSAFYEPGLSAGVRWDDPVFAIEWPPAERTILGRDRGYPDFDASVIEGFRGYLGEDVRR